MWCDDRGQGVPYTCRAKTPDEEVHGLLMKPCVVMRGAETAAVYCNGISLAWGTCWQEPGRL